MIISLLSISKVSPEIKSIKTAVFNQINQIIRIKQTLKTEKSMNNTIKVLEALAAGYSPTTGEVFDEESAVRDPIVIKALERAIYELSNTTAGQRQYVRIDKEEIDEIIELFQSQKIRLRSRQITNFLIAESKLENDEIKLNELYGKYENEYTFAQLHPIVKDYLAEQRKVKIEKETPWKKIDFFKKECFNKLSENAIEQLKEKVSELGENKINELPRYKLNARKKYPRAFEAWSEKEKQLLKKALQYTNDLELLGTCFQRGQEAIRVYGQKLIYETQTEEN